LAQNTNTTEWQNSHNLKIQDGGGRHLELAAAAILKMHLVNNFGLDEDILHKII